MTSEHRSITEAYVWVWLHESTEPVVAGRVYQEGDSICFNYGKSYLERKDAVSIYAPELPLAAGKQTPRAGLSMPGCLRDASPDAWGRRVILNRIFGIKGHDLDSADLSEFNFWLESGSDRLGALDFQSSASNFTPRAIGQVKIEELIESVERLEKGMSLSQDLAQALLHGTSIGGARPKALINDQNGRCIAKFSSSSDYYSVVKAEFIAMRLADLCGIKAAPVKLLRAANRDVLLVERFDRKRTEAGWQRKMVVSALTILELDEMHARYASYEDLCHTVRHRFKNPKATLVELFNRIVFNILSGNTDDHARNHAAFWDGEALDITPAYDICPQGRSGQEASQAMLISGSDRSSRLATCINAANQFLLTRDEAIALIEDQLGTIKRNWADICNEASLSQAEQTYFWGRQFLNPYAFNDLPTDASKLRQLYKEIR